MAVAGKVKMLLLCLIPLTFLNFAGPMWDQLDMAILIPLQRRNLSDAVFGRNGTSLSSRDSCTNPVTNFVFIKVHKTASDSTAVVLLRFAYKHHMIMCFKTKGMKLTFPRTTIYKSNCARWQVFGDRFSFIVQHTVFNKTAMDRVMKPGTKYIAIMREPLSHFRSQFFYFQKARRYGLTKNRNPLGTFLDDPERYSKSGERNMQAFIMGFPPDHLTTQDTRFMDSVIKQLGEWYTFVIINEYYEESLVMLRRKLCWDLSDILHSTKRIHKQHIRKKNIPLTDKQLENHKRTNALEYRMYHFFNRTFWKSVDEETGRGFWEEVAYFKGLVKRVNTYCSKRKKTKQFNVPTSEWNKPFSFNGNFCKGLRRQPQVWAKKLFDQMVRGSKT